MKKKKEEGKKPSSNKLFGTTTKVYMSLILFVSLAGIVCTYVLAFLGKDQIAETLSTDIVHTVIAVFITYAIKSFIENKSESDMALKRDVIFKDADQNGIDDALQEGMEIPETSSEETYESDYVG